MKGKVSNEVVIFCTSVFPDVPAKKGAKYEKY